MINERMQQLAGVPLSEARLTTATIEKYLKKGKEVWLFHDGNNYRGNYIMPDEDPRDWKGRDFVYATGYDGDPEEIKLKDVEWIEIDGKRISV
jgi:hypothetical protein